MGGSAEKLCKGTEEVGVRGGKQGRGFGEISPWPALLWALESEF